MGTWSGGSFMNYHWLILRLIDFSWANLDGDGKSVRFLPLIWPITLLAWSEHKTDDYKNGHLTFLSFLRCLIVLKLHFFDLVSFWIFGNVKILTMWLLQLP